MRRFETGGVDRDEFAAAIVGEFGLPVAADEFIAAFTCWPRALFPGATDAARRAEAAHFALASVSNTNDDPLAARFATNGRSTGTSITTFRRTASAALKPDAEYFEHVLDALGAAAARVLFVDDNAINVDAAARARHCTARRVAGSAGRARRRSLLLGLASGSPAMNLHRLLQARAAAGTPLRVVLIGAGKFGSMYLSQAQHTPGIHVVARRRPRAGARARVARARRLARRALRRALARRGRARAAPRSSPTTPRALIAAPRRRDRDRRDRQSRRRASATRSPAARTASTS